MTTRFILFLALIAWYLFSIYWYVCHIKNHACNCFGTKTPATQVTAGADTLATAATPRFTLADGSLTIVDVPHNADFAPASAQPQISAPMKDALAKTATYLKNNPAKMLQLTGYYGNAEKNNTMFDNLGLARADAIKQQLIAMGLPDAQIQTASQQNNSLPTLASGLLTNAISATIPANNAQAPPPFLVKDGSETVVNIPDNIQFNLSSDKPIINPNVQTGLNQLAQYLKNHPNRRLSIAGNYLKTEKNNTAADNLGIARANALKQQLTTLGADANQIETTGKLADKLSINNNTITGGIDWVFMVTAQKQQDLTAKSRILYFETGKATIAVNDELRQYFSDVKTYLDQNPKSSVLLTGHTDNVGATAANQNLGAKRADEVKQQLARLGIDKNKITTTSKGETQPVQTNNTPEGKKANRRVEMLVK